MPLHDKLQFDPVAWLAFQPKAPVPGGIWLCRGGCLKGSGLLVLNAPAEFVEAHKAGRKSRKNLALLRLDGMRGTLRLNKSGTCHVLEIGCGNAEIGVGYTPQFGPGAKLWTAENRGLAWSCKTTNGGGMDSLWVTTDPELVSRLRRWQQEEAARRAEEIRRFDLRMAAFRVQKAYEEGPWRGVVAHGEIARAVERLIAENKAITAEEVVAFVHDECRARIAEAIYNQPNTDPSWISLWPEWERREHERREREAAAYQAQFKAVKVHNQKAAAGTVSSTAKTRKNASISSLAAGATAGKNDFSALETLNIN